ncbi:MAG: hypothetical protein WA172_02855 [Terriglobales bacterium]
MAPSMKHTHLKMGRAKVHLDALYEMVEGFIKSKPYHVLAEDHVEAGEHIVTFTIDDPGFDAALIAGDFICCLRSALDYLAWQLATLTTSSPSRDVCFPICAKDSLETQLKITRQTFGIPDQAVLTIKSLQPYVYGEKYELSHLWRISKLWNIVKHRHVGMHSTVADFAFPKDLPAPKTEVRDDCGIMRFPITAKPDMNLYPGPEIDIFFGDEGEGIITFIDDLADAYQFVGTEVLPQFEKFFPK